jgi:hypothetical protein
MQKLFLFVEYLRRLENLIMQYESERIRRTIDGVTSRQWFDDFKLDAHQLADVEDDSRNNFRQMLIPITISGKTPPPPGIGVTIDRP